MLLMRTRCRSLHSYHQTKANTKTVKSNGANGSVRVTLSWSVGRLEDRPLTDANHYVAPGVYLELGAEAPHVLICTTVDWVK